MTKISIEEAIKAGFAKEIEKYKAEVQAGLQAEIEGQKTSLAKSETIFTRQLEALTILRRTLRGILPKKRYLEMERSDAYEDIARSFKEHANDLDEFLCSHSVALPTDVLQGVETAIAIATEGQFELQRGHLTGPNANAVAAADKFWETVRSAANSLQTTVDAQICGRT